MLTESETLNSHIKTYPWHLYSMVCCNSWSPSELALEFSRLMNIMLKQTEEGSLGSRTSGNKYLITSNFCKYLVPLLSKPQCSSDLPYWHSLTIFFFFFYFSKSHLLCILKTTRDKTLKSKNINNSIQWCFAIVTCNSPISIKKKKKSSPFLQMNKGILLS